MIEVQNGWSAKNNSRGYAVAENKIEKESKQEAEKTEKTEKTEPVCSMTGTLDPDASLCYDRKLFQPEHRQEMLEKMINSMSRAEEHDKIKELKDVAWNGEIYVSTIRNGKVHISGGKGYENKARTYETLVNASLNRSWNCLFRGSMVKETELLDKVSEVLKYYSNIDCEIAKKDKNDSIVNHADEAFQRWCSDFKPKNYHFDGRI